MRATLEARFWAKVDRRDPDACWPWTGYVTPAGYGKMYFGRGEDGRSRYEWAHRVAWLLAHGALPAGHIDHVHARGCRRRDCMNPSHLEVVTPAENTRRSMSESMVLHRAGFCRNGHPRSEACLRRGTNLVVYCKACRREARAAA